MHSKQAMRWSQKSWNWIITASELTRKMLLHAERMNTKERHAIFWKLSWLLQKLSGLLYLWLQALLLSDCHFCSIHYNIASIDHLQARDRNSHLWQQEESSRLKTSMVQIVVIRMTTMHEPMVYDNMTTCDTQGRQVTDLPTCSSICVRSEKLANLLFTCLQRHRQSSKQYWWLSSW